MIDIGYQFTNKSVTTVTRNSFMHVFMFTDH
jgi:hypothetical protein